MDERVVGRLAAVMKREHRHHEAGRAEAALGGMGIDQHLLHGMKRAVRCRQAFNREERAIVDLRQHHQAGIHRLVSHGTIALPAKDDGAGAAIALGTAFLGAGEMRAGTQPIKHRHESCSAARCPRRMAFRSTGTAPLSWLTSLHAHPRGVGSGDDALQSADQMRVWQSSPCCIEDTHSHACSAASPPPW